MSEPITNLETAVRELGALPMPAGPERTPAQAQPRTMLDHARDALNARMTKDDLRLVLENVITYAASLETQIAELRAERHSTNEALDDVVRELRARREDMPAQRSVEKLTRLLAPSVEGEHYATVHHNYRTPRDLPPLGGAR